jgi:hypothetical protein
MSNDQPDVYRTRDGQVITGPGAAVARAAAAQLSQCDETKLIRLLELAIIDGRDEDRKRIESQIMRARLASGAAQASRTRAARGTAEEHFARKDEEQREHWSVQIERMTRNGGTGR